MSFIIQQADPRLALILIGLAALSVNVPLGYLREGRRKFSLGWFVYIHLSIPLVAFLRIESHLSAWFIPLFILFAIAGQVIGGRVRRRKEPAS
ncbi:MAG TPA: hypothetical protein DD658_00610 [Deltaproteobacteria bacterium]|nr:MAG: hypothetical protein A2X88_08150 [Deltaproteobacteria bacterium GWC2_65_14]HBO68723.1 hypothetical protein [Deltaproteobacteria bacterium]